MENLNLNEIINLLSVLSIAAVIAGFMAGLLGVGGGIIMVPALYYAFTVLDFDLVTRMHLSVGTSLAIIIPTSIISTKTHMEYDAVDFKMVKSFGFFIILGVFCGTFLAVNLKTPTLVLFFALFSFCVGLFFIFLREQLMDKPKNISELIKKSPTIKANIEKNKTKAAVFKFTAKKVPAITPNKIKIPNDFTILKSTASYSICVFVEIIEVGIIIAKEVPTDKCILVIISKSKTVKA